MTDHPRNQELFPVACRAEYRSAHGGAITARSGAERQRKGCGLVVGWSPDQPTRPTARSPPRLLGMISQRPTIRLLNQRALKRGPSVGSVGWSGDHSPQHVIGPQHTMHEDFTQASTSHPLTPWRHIRARASGRLRCPAVDSWRFLRIPRPGSTGSPVPSGPLAVRRHSDPLRRRS